MNDQLDHPENSAAEGSTPTDAQSGADVAGNDGGPQHATGGTAAPQRRSLKKRNAAPKRRPGHPARGAASAASHTPHHYDKLVDEGENEGFFGRHRTKVVIGAFALLGAGAFYFLSTAKHTATVKAPEKMVVVSLPPLPPPPPPPPPPKREPPPPKPEQKMEKESAPEDKPKEEAPKAPEPPKEALGTGVKGNGPGIAGLGSSGNGGGFGGPKSGGGSKYGYYAGMVQSKVTQALQSNGHTRSAAMDIKVRIWPDSTGRITRVALDTKTGDPKLDAAIQNEVLANLQLAEPPPAGMPLPIVMRLTARKR